MERRSSAELGWAAALIAVFVGVVFWFNGVDFYHKHFFDHGPIVLAENIARLGFLFIFAWLLYAPGAAVGAVLLRRSEQAEPTPAERAVLAFGLGIGLWHVPLLILGVAGLYYRSAIIALAAIVVLASARQFGALASAAIGRLSASVRRRCISPQIICILLITVFAGWLLLIRGFYPNTDGDYFSHYFYYYQQILNNHNLAPNDIWYHYYYSKGDGLFFLGMLLSDPEAPTLATFCCVVIAAVAMAVVAYRIAPSSLWPGCVAALYLAFNLTSYRNLGGAQFEKTHEEVSALIMLMACALCLARGPAARVWLTVAVSGAVAVAIIAQPVGVLVAVYFMVAAVWVALRHRRDEMRGYGLAGVAVGGTVAAMLLLNYWATGLADDHALGLMLRFADVARLDRWGVLPQLVIVAWMRANYLHLTPPAWDWALTSMLPAFLRLSQLWVFFIGSALALSLVAGRWIASRGHGAGAQPAPTGESAAASAATLRRIGAIVLVFAIISVPAGYGEAVSFLSVSSFFFPLLAMMATAACGWAAMRSPVRWEGQLLNRAFPVFLLAATVFSWHGDWRHRAARDSDNALRFLVGGYSLAEAYSRQDVGPPYGGINPRTLAASRQVEPGTPIWSTSIEYSYCVAPGCWVESVYSFKLSGRLDEIVTATPDRAKQLLQEAGLNYFLVASDSRLVDLLPYSKLFSPDAIGRYLAIKWTDGTAYHLTWAGSPGTTPITPEFVDSYRKLLDQPDQPETRFRYLAPQLAEVTDKLRNKSWGAPAEFARQPTPAPAPDGTLDITDATYGENCRGYTPAWSPFNTVYRGNATDAVREACSGATRCRFTVDARQLGDPAFGCDKDFSVAYRCRHDSSPLMVTLQPEAGGKTVNLSCPAAPP
jgi:hypothetical protein